jgi:hypothetical protein
LAPGRKPRHRKAGGAGKYYLAVGLFVVIVGGIAWYAYLLPHQGQGTKGAAKPVILYVNQGNGIVNVTNFGAMAEFAVAHGFNTVFFQIYRAGVLLFSQQALQTFVNQAHQKNLSIFFALSFTKSSQQMPSSIYGSGEDGVSLDMLTLGLPTQRSLLATLKIDYNGTTAVTTSNMSSTLKPDLLVLETYASDTKPCIRPGIIGSVEVVAASSQADYHSQFQYALKNSDGVMVFDYAGLLRSRY